LVLFFLETIPVAGVGAPVILLHPSSFLLVEFQIQTRDAEGILQRGFNLIDGTSRPSHVVAQFLEVVTIDFRGGAVDDPRRNPVRSFRLDQDHVLFLASQRATR
jgi:hypothetical protein